MASYIVVDVEMDGPVSPKYSMVCFGAVIVRPNLKDTFYGQTKPISDIWIPDALKVSGFSREQHLQFPDPEKTMLEFEKWIKEYSVGKPTLISDNPGFDFGALNYYFHYFLGRNPFGHSARRIGDIYCGLMKDAGLNHEWKRKYRKTKHDHSPINDAIGNAEAILAFKEKLGLKIKLE